MDGKERDHLKAGAVVVYSIYCFISERVKFMSERGRSLSRRHLEPLKTNIGKARADGRRDETDGVAGGGDRDGGGVRPHFSRRR